MEHVIVERVFAEPVNLDELEKKIEESKSCFGVREVTLVRSSVSRDGLRMICEYRAPDAESVRVANQLAGQPFERVWTARVYEVGV